MLTLIKNENFSKYKSGVKDILKKTSKNLLTSLSKYKINQITSKIYEYKRWFEKVLQFWAY